MEIHRATPWPTDETGCLSPNGGWVGSICRYPTTTLATRKSQVATRQAFCRTVGSRPSGERHKSAGAGGKGHTPMFGLEFNGARDRAASDRGPRASLSPQAPRGSDGTGGGRARRLRIGIFRAGDRRCIAGGSAHFPLHRHRRLAHALGQLQYTGIDELLKTATPAGTATYRRSIHTGIPAGPALGRVASFPWSFSLVRNLAP